MSCGSSHGVDMEVFVNDLLPTLEIDVTKGGSPFDLTLATSVNVLGFQDGVQVFSRPATSVVVARVTMDWQVGDTDTIGPMKVFVQAVFPGPKPQTIEPDNHVMIMRLP